MKNLFTLLILSFVFFSCSENPVEPIHLPKDDVKMQFQLNTSLSDATQYVVYADYGDGYLYQPITEVLYRGDDIAYYLKWSFLRSSIKADAAKFKIMAHRDNTPGSEVTLGVIFYYK